jgi:hypothetical protein
MAKILVTEEQFQMLMKRITEEAAGYDDFNVMGLHATQSMKVLVDSLTDLSQVLRGVVHMLKSEHIEYIDLRENLYLVIELISEINMAMDIVFKDFTERKVIKTGKILHRKLESYQEKIRMMLDMGEELISKENIIDKLTDLTMSVHRAMTDYAAELKVADIKFKNTVERGRPRPKTDLN